MAITTVIFKAMTNTMVITYHDFTLLALLCKQVKQGPQFFIIISILLKKNKQMKREHDVED